MSRWKWTSLLATLALQAQTPMPPPATVPLYRVSVLQSTTKAINYRSGSTKIDFKGTVLAPTASGMAKVACSATATQIKAKFEGMPAPSQFGPEYLTYVLWAVSPEGRANNLGEIPLKHGKGDLKVSQPLQAFGLIVTAEPYFAVTQPSDVVVMENAMRKGTDGTSEPLEAKFDLLKRGHYHMNASPEPPATLDPKIPFDVYQARNAVAIAKASGAQNYAADSLVKAERLLAQAEAPAGNTRDRIIAAREAVQGAEDARLISSKRQETEALETERKQAQAKVDQATQEAATAAAALANADHSRQTTLNENSDLKQKLLAQLNGILQTRASARGLIVNMSGVTFKTGKADLLPAAREKLAKIAGLILAHPGLKVESEGYTDNTGSDEINQRLSEQRAQAARDFLVAQGVSPDAIMHRGLGKASPIDSNDSPAGRQNNRRVELVVSGTGITGEAPSAN